MLNLEKLSKRGKIYLAIILSISIVCLFVFVAAFFITKDLQRDSLGKFENKQVFDVENFILTETKNGKKYWELYAERGHYDNTQSIAILEGAIGNFYEENEVVVSVIASRGTLNQNTKEVSLYDDVTVVLKDDISIKADSLIWEANEETLTAKGNVIIKKGKDLVTNSEKAILSDNFSKLAICGKSKIELFEN